MDCSTPGFPVHHQLPELFKLMSIESVMPSNHLILCHPLLLPPLIFPRIRVFSSKSVPCIRRSKYWSFNFSISSSNEYSGLISFRMDWLDLLAVQGTLKSLLQQHSSKASVLQRSAFFIVQLSHPCFLCGSAGKESACNVETWVWSMGWEDPLEKGKATHSSILAWRIPSPWGCKESETTERLSLSHPYMTRRKTTALTRRTFVGKCESWTLKTEHQRINDFELWCWRRLLKGDQTSQS